MNDVLKQAELAKHSWDLANDITGFAPGHRVSFMCALGGQEAFALALNHEGFERWAQSRNLRAEARELEC